jgi:hypothetical protein
MAIEPTGDKGKAASWEMPADGTAAGPDRSCEQRTSLVVDHRRKADVADRQEPTGFLGGEIGVIVDRRGCERSLPDAGLRMTDCYRGGDLREDRWRREHGLFIDHEVATAQAHLLTG